MASGINTLQFPVDQSGAFGCGSNARGQFNSAGEKTTLFQINTSGSDIIDVSCGASTSYYLTTSGTVKSDGVNSNGQCGQNLSVGLPSLGEMRLTDNSIFQNVHDFSIGKDHGIVVNDNGDVYVCGNNNDGELGIPIASGEQIALTPTLSGQNITKVLAGFNSSYALSNNGSLYTVGDNGFGQLGIGNTTSPIETWQSGFINNAKDFYLGEKTLFILYNDNTARAVGNNTNGQLGINSESSTITDLTLISINNQNNNIIKIDGGSNHTLFLTNTNEVYAVGNNSAGQLGVGDTSSGTPSPVKVSGLPQNIVDIAAGTNVSFAMTKNGIIYAWGDNQFGAIGQNTSTGIFTEPTIMISGSGFNLIDSMSVQMMAVSSGNIDISPQLFIHGKDSIDDDFSLFIQGPQKATSLDNTEIIDLFGFGQNAYQQFGISGEQSTPHLIASFDQSPLDFSCGSNHLGFVDSSGLPITIGRNHFGQCGQNISSGISPLSSGQMSFSGGSLANNIQQIACGLDHTLVLDISGNIWSCGRNSLGQLGIGNTDDQIELIPSMMSGNITKIIAGSLTSYALRDDNRAITVGSNIRGELVQGVGFLGIDSDPHPDWSFVGSPGATDSGVSGIVDLWAGVGTVFAKFIDGSVSGAGWNAQGKLGINSLQNDVPSFQEIHGISGIQKVAGGSTHSLFLLENGEVYSAGSNEFGQLGDLTNNSSIIPIKVSGLPENSIIDVQANNNSSFALASDGIWYGWGRNHVGQLGIGTSSGEFNYPIVLDNASGFIELTDASTSLNMLAGANKGPRLLAFGHERITNNTDLFVHGITSDQDSLELFISGPKLFTSFDNENPDSLLGLGENDGSEFGVSGLKDQLFSIDINDEKIDQIDIGGQHILIKNQNNILKSQGSNEFGQCGQNQPAADISLSLDNMIFSGGSIASGISGFSAGNLHNIVLNNSGNVYGCGFASNGQLGLGSDTNDKIFLTPIYTSGDITQVAAGSDHSLLLRNDGHVLGVGINSHGQLAQGTQTATENNWIFVGTGVSGISNVSEIFAGGFCTFVKLSDGTVQGAGHNIDGELGINSDTFFVTNFVTVSGLTNIKKVSTDTSLSIFLTEDGNVYSVGDNNKGQLGIGTSGGISKVPIQVSGLPHSQIIDIASNSDVAYALTDNGVVYGWGNNNEGQIGQGHTSGIFSLPIIIKGGSGFKTLAVDDFIGLAQRGPFLSTFGLDRITDSADLFIDGVLKDNDSLDLFINGRINSINTLQHPTANSGLFGCGRNFFDQLIIPNEQTTLSQIPITGAKGFGCGEFHSFYITQNSNIISAGENDEGQAGQGSGTTSPLGSGFVVDNNDQIFNNAQQVSCGTNHSIVLDTSGNVYVCGDSSQGQLGLGFAAVDHDKLVPTLSGNNITKVIASDRFSLALRDDGKCYAAGDNSQGQLGQGDTNDEVSWVFLGGGSGESNIKDIGAGRLHTFIVQNDGTVLGAGFNTQGQLGLNNTTSPITNFTQVSGISGVIKAVGGIIHSLFLLDTGEVYSVGSDSEGQLGNNALVGGNELIPIKVSNLPSNIIDIAAGDNLSYALTSDGTIYAWGTNDEGALGQGTSTGDEPLPVIMISGSGFNTIQQLYGDSQQMTALAEGFEDISPPLFISGPNQSTDDFDLFISALATNDDNIDLFINGIDQETDNIDLFINGPILTSGDFDLFITAPTPVDSNIDLFISGPNLATDNLELFIQGKNTQNNNIDLFIISSASANNQSDLFINGVNIPTASIDLFVNNSGIDDELDQIITGHKSISGVFDFFIGSLQTWNTFVKTVKNNPTDQFDLVIKGFSGTPVSFLDDNFTLFIENDSQPPIFQKEFQAFVKITNQEPIISFSGSWGIFVNVGHTINNNREFFIQGHASGDNPHGIETINNFNLFTQGLGDIISSGFTPISKNQDVFVKIHSGILDSINLFISGQIIPSANINCFIFGIQDLIDNNIHMFIDGSSDIFTDNINAYIMGIKDIETSSIDCFIQVTNVGNISGFPSLYIHGF